MLFYFKVYDWLVIMRPEENRILKNCIYSVRFDVEFEVTQLLNGFGYVVCAKSPWIWQFGYLTLLSIFY